MDEAPGTAGVPNGVTRVAGAVAPNCLHWWFASIDGRFLDVGGERWRAQVAGIHVWQGDLWIQIEPAGSCARGLVLRVKPETPVHAAVTVLRTIRTGRNVPVVVDARRARPPHRRVARPIRRIVPGSTRVVAPFVARLSQR